MDGSRSQIHFKKKVSNISMELALAYILAVKSAQNSTILILNSTSTEGHFWSISATLNRLILAQVDHHIGCFIA